MKKSKTIWNDFLFEHRNKLYGAYVIRNEAPWNLLKSLLISCVFITLFVVGFSFMSKSRVEPFEPTPEPLIYTITKIEEVQKIKKPVVDVPKVQNRPKVKNVDSNIIPNPAEDPEEEKPLNTQENMGAAETDEDGDENFNGSVVYGDENENEDGTETLGEEVPENTKDIYNIREVSKMAIFPGCEKVENDALLNCMSDKLQNELGIQLRDFGAIADKYNIDVAKTRIQFVVDTSGRITQIKILNGTHSIFNAEAAKALRQVADRYEKRNKFLQPAELNDGTKVNMNFVIPLQYLMK